MTTKRYMSWHNHTLDLIGNTPLVRLNSFDTGLCTLLVKLESMNPGGSIKDRIGRSMIEAAERDGTLKPGATLVEATAGNTGLGLALVAASKGYKLILVIPDKMSQEKVLHLRALGAEIVMTRSDVGKGHPAYYQDMAERMAREIPGAFYVNQFNNPSNSLAHELTTGPEILAQTDGKVDAVVCGVGSGGTLAGMSRYFATHAPHVEMVLADPAGSILKDYIETGTFGKAGSWIVEGIGEDFIPSIADFSRVKRAYSISDAESIATARKLLSAEGILGGSSSGTLIAAALKYCKEQVTPKVVVTFICDTGNKYLSKLFNDNWMYDQGFGETSPTGDLRDLIGRPCSRDAVVSVMPSDTLAVAYGRMRVADVSQLPVLEGERIVGLVDEGDLLLAVDADPAGFDRSVASVMSGNLVTIRRDAAREELTALLKRGLTAVVSDELGFHGLITRIDVLNHLRGQYQRMHK